MIVPKSFQGMHTKEKEPQWFPIKNQTKQSKNNIIMLTKNKTKKNFKCLEKANRKKSQNDRSRSCGELEEGSGV